MFVFIAMCHLKAITQNKNYKIFYRWKCFCDGSWQGQSVIV